MTDDTNDTDKKPKVVKIKPDTNVEAKVGRPSKYHPSMLPKMIAVAKKGASKAEMALEIGISRETFNNWEHSNPEFRDAVKQAELHAQIWWEQLGRSGAKGEQQGFNATAFIFQMKNRFRADYMDVQRAEVTGKDGGPIQTEAVVVDSSTLSPETRAALRAALEATLEESEDE